MRILRSIKLPDEVRPGQEVKAAHLNRFRRALMDLSRWCSDNEIMPSADIGLKADGSPGKVLYLKRRPAGGGGGPAPIPCYFGELTNYSETEGSDSTETEKTGIRGGYVEAGKKVWNMPHREINLEASGEFMVYIKVNVTANTDDSHSVVLSGLETSEEPTWEYVGGSDDYPEKTIPKIFPTSNPGKGIAIVPIGKLIVLDGSARLEPTGCGNIVIDHCPGVLTHHRGPVTANDSTSS